MKNGFTAYLSEVYEDKTRVQASRLEAEETLVDFEVDEAHRFCYLASAKTVDSHCTTMF